VEELRFILMKREAGDSLGRMKEKINGTNNCSQVLVRSVDGLDGRSLPKRQPRG
jgi:hypothetical protein